ncbi:aldehyde dehydrogenase [Thermotalea metallivorans]|uniref:Aldehyde dehydrogenase n=1 Tax=Thermotalea metallivorans TaxID=520762 RepID=A0A140L7B9_9FIRM|nr:aldehyde dehydrogenase [Thermotalea metallivorans]KXG76444.1 Aldehyde dehydrogenase [Thermotalea metallivorans]
MEKDYVGFVKEILKEHKTYFDTGKTKDLSFRMEQLKKLKRAIQAYESRLLDALYKDLRKPAFEAYATEVGYVLDSIGYTLKHFKSWAKVKRVATPIIHLGAQSYIYPEPYGTVLIIAPWNYPFQLLIEPLIGAIAAGNCAVLKPSEYTPHVAQVMESMIKECFDERYIRMVSGEKEMTAALIHGAFDYIFFTGSVPVGKIVMEAAAKNLVPVTLELGGKSPCIVDKEAHIAVAAKRIAWGKFLNAGQTCVAPDYLIVHREIKKIFIPKLIEAIKKFYGDDPAQSQDYCRIVSNKHMERLIGLMDREKIIYGGAYDLEDLYIAPTVMDNVTWDDPIMADEIFGPLLPVLEYEDLDQVIHRINGRPKPLALYVFSENKTVQKEIIRRVSFGGGCINDTLSHVASPYIPFGGVGPSGMGAYHGKSSFDTFSHKKSVMKRTTKFSIPLAFPPYKDKMKLLKKWMK